MLFDSTGKIWFIDHTRSFLPSAEIDELDKIVWCDRKMWERLQALDEDLLYKHLRSYLDHRQIITALKRRDKLVDHLEGLIDQRGKNSVLFEQNLTSPSKIMSSEW